ncbi:MAG: hypothetical protein N3A38_01340 [Planctomycetota bacterium]|nr:hypothetical protein [Planctomycetota bacterium]
MAAHSERQPPDPEMLEQGDGWEHWRCGRVRWWVIRFREGSYARSRDRLERQLRRGTEPVVFVIPRARDLDSLSLGGFLLCAESSEKAGRMIGLVGRQAAAKLRLVMKMMGIKTGHVREFSCLEAAESAILHQDVQPKERGGKS